MKKYTNIINLTKIILDLHFDISVAKVEPSGPSNSSVSELALERGSDVGT